MEIHLSKSASSLLREGTWDFMVLKIEFSDLIWRPRGWQNDDVQYQPLAHNNLRIGVQWWLERTLCKLSPYEMKNTICHRQETLNDTFSRENVMSGSCRCERRNLRIFSATCLFHPRRWCVDSAVRTHRSSDLRRWTTDDRIISNWWQYDMRRWVSFQE